MLDLKAIEEKWLQQCGACDAGLPMSCTCPTEDYRSVLLELVRQVERLRFEASPGPDRECPRCGRPVDRDSADVGVGVIYGPYGCGCGWSESKEYDRLFGQGSAPEGYAQDTRGGWTPK